MNIEIIVGILLLIKAIIVGIQTILLEDVGIRKRTSIILHNNIITSSFILYVVIHYPITENWVNN